VSSNAAELTLILKAKYLAQVELDKLKTGLTQVKDRVDDVKTAAVGLRDKFRTAVEGSAAELTRFGRRMRTITGNLVQDLFSGQDLQSAFSNAGIMGAGALVESFGGKAVASFTGSALIARIGAGLAVMAAATSAFAATAGAAIGAFIAAAIPIGMALLPLLLVAAVVAAIVFLVNNPKIVGQIIDFAASVIKAFIGALVSLPGKIADVIRQAFANIKIDIGPFHIRSSGITIDMPSLSTSGLTPEQAANYHLTGQVPATHHAIGGWTGLHGPELTWTGERGPEFVVPNHRINELLGGRHGSAPEVHIHLAYPPSRSQIAQIVRDIEPELYRVLQRSSPTQLRT
jgi:hypothetical protein